jgi:hypothetical protein
VTLHVGATRDRWREEHGPPLLLEGALAVWTDGTITIGVGVGVRDGELRPLADLLGDYVETRPDAMRDRFVGRVALRLDLLATPVPPPDRVDEPLA